MKLSQMILANQLLVHATALKDLLATHSGQPWDVPERTLEAMEDARTQLIEGRKALLRLNEGTEPGQG